MRTKKSMINSGVAIFSSVITMLIGFVGQAIFIRILGSEYLGLNGLFTNILTLLSFFELGIGNAIVFHLYEPILKENKEKIKSLLFFYKKAYRIISLLVFICGLLLIPFLKVIIGEISIDVNIYIIYLMFLINTSISYLLSYKKNLIEANQNNYIINLVHLGYIIILNITQLLILFFTKNYYLYLGIKILLQVIENLINSYIANKMYPYIKEKATKLDKNTALDIFKKVKALFFHKIGGSVINGTDNIIISYFFGVATVGLYANYYMIIGSVSNMFRLVINSSTASVGNLLASNETTLKKFIVFKKMRFLNFVLSTFSGVCILLIITPFIKIWIGNAYTLDMFVTITLVFNYFQKTQRNIYQTFKDAMGVWHEDRFVPLIESLLNIVFSVLLLKIFGLAGVFMGTMVSGLILWGYSYPRYVYKKIFNRSYFNYAIETLGYILLFIIIASTTYYISLLITFDNLFLQLLSNSIIALVIPNLFILIIFRKTDNFKYFTNIIHK